MTLRDRIAMTIAEGYIRDMDPGRYQYLVGYYGDIYTALLASDPDIISHNMAAAALLMERFFVQDKQ